MVQNIDYLLNLSNMRKKSLILLFKSMTTMHKCANKCVNAIVLHFNKPR